MSKDEGGTSAQKTSNDILVEPSFRSQQSLVDYDELRLFLQVLEGLLQPGGTLDGFLSSLASSTKDVVQAGNAYLKLKEVYDKQIDRPWKLLQDEVYMATYGNKGTGKTYLTNCLLLPSLNTKLGSADEVLVMKYRSNIQREKQSLPLPVSQRESKVPMNFAIKAGATCAVWMAVAYKGLLSDDPHYALKQLLGGPHTEINLLDYSSPNGNELEKIR